ncbi:MAG: hypothetical protein IJC74_03570 [Clostridia bacterium]|nr:hypothetical protein [Clostridia bacterium]
MKKIISLILTFTILASMAGIFTVNAEIPAGNGMGVELAFKALSGTSPSSGTFIAVSELETTDYDSAYNYTYKQTGGGKNPLQFRMDFTNTQTVAAGDKIYISFYYKFNDTDTYDVGSYFQRRNYTNSSSGKTTIGTVSTEWQKAEFITTSGVAVAANTDVTQIFLVGMTVDAPLSLDIAEPKCVYFGAVTGDDPDGQIMDAIAKAESTPDAPAINVNNGKGQTMAFNQIKRNSPSNDAGGAFLSTVEDTTFGTVDRYTYTAATANNVQMSLTFTNNQNIAVGDTVNLSFYYRFTDDETFDLPVSLKHRNNINVDYAGQVNVATSFTSGVWAKANITLTADSAISSGTDVFLRFLTFITTGNKICLDIANPTLVYFGNVNSDDVTAEINTQLNKSDFSSISIGGTAIDLTANPTSYTTTEAVTKDDITAIGYHNHSVVKIASEEGDNTVTYTLTSYATGYDFTNANDTRYTTYTITAAKPAPPISVNDGKGQALEFDYFTGLRPSDAAYFDIYDLDDTGFEKAYRYEYLGTFSANPIQTQVAFKNNNNVAAGEYFYISFYYRFVTDNTHTAPTTMVRRTYANDSGSAKTTVTTDITSNWTKGEFIVTNLNAIKAGTPVDLRFLLNISDTTDKIYMDIANPTCVYFGAVTGDAEDAINEQISKSAISSVKINGKAIDLAANPTSYETTEKAELDNIVVEGWQGSAATTKSVSKADGKVTCEYTVYAADYDFLTSPANGKSTYTVTTAAPDYDIYNYEYDITANGYTVNALFDNNTTSTISFDYIVALYNLQGELLGVKSVNYSDISASTTENKLSATIEGIGGNTSIDVKIFIWNSKTGLVPVLNTRTIG